MLLMDIRQADAEKTLLLNSLEQIDLELVKAQGLSDRVLTDLQETEKSIQSDPNEMDKLRLQVEKLEDETAQMEEVEFGDRVREFVGDGNRQYLTGLKLGGERVLILVDGSASMLADTVVNAVRRRNMDDEQKKQSPKWQWTLRTVEWLVAQLPASSRFQIYIFNISAEPALIDSKGEWLDAADSLVMEEAIAGLRQYSPGSGTSLTNGFGAIADFEDRPDNVFLLTDGLPTQGKNPPKKYMVSGGQRRSYFLAAMKEFPRGVPLNTILFPMEGDPEAAALFWQTALDTDGAFIAPSRDWP
jgi:hypothetical protein